MTGTDVTGEIRDYLTRLQPRGFDFSLLIRMVSSLSVKWGEGEIPLFQYFLFRINVKDFAPGILLTK